MSQTTSIQSRDPDWISTPLKELLNLSWPIATSMLSYSVMSLADTLFVGRLGSSALAGVGTASTIAFGICCFPMGMLRAVKVLVSQSVGAKQPASHVRAYLGAGLILALLLGLMAVFVGRWLAPWISGLTATTEAGRCALQYLTIRMLQAPFFLAYVTIREVRYGLSDARSPMVASIAANAVNIVLDAVFILGLDWNVSGAAWATVIASAFEMLFLVAGSFREGLGIFTCRFRHIVSIVKLGFPTGLQFVLEIGSFVVLAVMISALSEIQMAAHQIALQVVHFSFLPAFAVSEASSVLTGQAVGANRDDLVRRISALGVKTTTVYNGFCTLVFVGSAHWITTLFSPQVQVQVAATHLLYLAAAFQLADGANMVYRGVLRGTGDVRIPALIGILTAWALTPPLTWLLGYEAGLGALGAWLGLCAEIFLGAALLRSRLARGSWLSAAQRSRIELSITGTIQSREDPVCNDLDSSTC